MTGASSIQSAASSEGAQTSKGLINQGVVSTDQYTIDTAFKSPFMVRKTDERGDEHVQMLGTGVVGSLAEARAIIDRSFPVERFDPVEPDRWDALATIEPIHPGLLSALPQSAHVGLDMRE